MSPDGSPLPEADGYASWLAVGAAFLKCQRVLSGWLKPLDLSIAQHEILVKIYRFEGLTQNELAAHLLVVKSNITAMIQRLEARDLVRRTTDPDDNRRRHLFLTAAGANLVRRSFAVQNRVIELMMARLEPEELETIDAVMAKVSDALDSADAEEPEGGRETHPEGS